MILKFDGKTVEKHTDLPRIVGNTKPGQKVTMEVWRNGATREVNLTLGEMEPRQAGGAARKKTPAASPRRRIATSRPQRPRPGGERPD